MKSLTTKALIVALFTVALGFVSAGAASAEHDPGTCQANLNGTECELTLCVEGDPIICGVINVCYPPGGGASVDGPCPYLSGIGFTNGVSRDGDRIEGFSYMKSKPASTKVVAKFRGE